ncbi:recombinase family protein [Lacipirellula sp.]|uniref:recombinase family protein n=1 Tax=Lacipirellula sp. TaxID=2691419 RepID=UPI003D0E80B9
MKIIAYVRVSTNKQAASGLGLEAQQAAVTAFAQSNSATIASEFIEVETGKRADRPELARAIAACRRQRATLVIAKLDRLARNVAFVANLMEARVPFVACDNPNATPLTVHILSAVAEDEAKRISQRTKDALARAKARGTVLGKPANLTESARRKGTVANIQAAHRHASLALPLARKLRDAGETLVAIANHLTDGGMLTRTGKAWSATSVLRLLA